ncbi:MAG: helix-turn-helix domain-containing protein [Candidatus Omnitrophica bacterium]|nr:helix-turn-helix domain-containing protein [Candidatus Omnitrophota bacterium]
MNDRRMSITDVAERVGVTPKTIVRWEKAKKVRAAKRDWRGWRVYDKDDLKTLKSFKETIIYMEGGANENSR